jgi:hypothetical protein
MLEIKQSCGNVGPSSNEAQVPVLFPTEKIKAGRRPFLTYLKQPIAGRA